MAIPHLEMTYVEGSPWRPPDPNAVADTSKAFQQEWEQKHENDGRHNDGLIPMESATVNSAGTILQGSSGIAVSRLAAGQYLIDISASPMLVAAEWFAHCYPDAVSTDLVIAFESEQAGATAKDETKTEVRFVNDSGSYVDVGFWVGCYGVRG
jgi:hypothetical protein